MLRLLEVTNGMAVFWDRDNPEWLQPAIYVGDLKVQGRDFTDGTPLDEFIRGIKSN